MMATSRDGLTWKLAPGLDARDDTTLLGATASQAGVQVAVGSEAVFDHDETQGLVGTVRGVIFRKDTGGTWGEVPRQPSMDGGDARGVVATPAGFVAYGGYEPGVVGLGCSWGCLPGAGIWFSTDGLTWDGALLESPTREDVYVDFGGVVRHAGRLLAYAARSSDSEPAATLLWSSPDGRTWSAVEPIGLEGVRLLSIISTPEGLLGVTETDEGSGPTVYRSSDGLSWLAVSPMGPSLWGIAAVDGGFVAWDNIIMRETYGAWSSVDAITWNQQDAYEPFYAGAMVSLGRTVVSIGSNSGYDPVWVGTLTPRS